MLYVIDSQCAIKRCGGGKKNCMQAFVLCVSSLGRTQAVARQAEGEQTAFPHSGMQGDVAVMLVDDLLAQGQSDARTGSVWWCRTGRRCAPAPPTGMPCP